MVPNINLFPRVYDGLSQAEIYDVGMEIQEKGREEARLRFMKEGGESKNHRKKFSCPCCALPLGTGEAVGIGRDAYHPGCAVQMLAARKQAAD